MPPTLHWVRMDSAMILLYICSFVYKLAVQKRKEKSVLGLEMGLMWKCYYIQMEKWAQHPYTYINHPSLFRDYYILLFRQSSRYVPLTKCMHIIIYIRIKNNWVHFKWWWWLVKGMKGKGCDFLLQFVKVYYNCFHNQS